MPFSGVAPAADLPLHTIFSLINPFWPTIFFKSVGSPTTTNSGSTNFTASLIPEKSPVDFGRVLFLPYYEGIYNNSKRQGFEYTSSGFRIEVKFADFKVEEPEDVSGLLILQKHDGSFVNAIEIIVPIKNNLSNTDK